MRARHPRRCACPVGKRVAGTGRDRPLRHPQRPAGGQKERRLDRTGLSGAARRTGDAPHDLLSALGVNPKFVVRCGAKYVIEVETEKEVRNLTPDFERLRRLPGRGVAVTSLASSPKYNFVSRYFAPWVGIDEDPVTAPSTAVWDPIGVKSWERKN